MKLFGRKAKDEGEAPPAEPQAPPIEEPAPPAWALPADAAVAAAGSTVGPPPPAAGADRASTTGQPSDSPGLSAAAVTGPAAGAGADPAGPAAAQETASAAPPPHAGGGGQARANSGEAGAPSSAGPAYGSETSAAGTLATAQQKPELMVAGAFVGAFLAARILRRITE